MMERKFTDDEIVKALECCSKDSMESLREAYAIYEETTGLKWARAEAVKEFAERWKKYWKAQMDVSTNQHQDEIVLRDIDNLVKEMTGEDNGN